MIMVPLAATEARADAVADLRAGATLALHRAQVSVGPSPRATSATTFLRKDAGSLDIALPAADLGVDLPVTLHLRGGAVTGPRIAYTVDERFSPPIELGGGQSLDRIAGQLTAVALPLAGVQTPLVGNVRLRLEGAGTLTAVGTWGALPITIDQLELEGGLIQPPLLTFTAPGGIICSAGAPSDHVFAVTLSEPARGTGANVSFATPVRRGVHFPVGTVVRAGQRSASVTARVDADFVGTVRVNAAAAGTVRTLDVEIHPARDCERR